LSYRFGPFVLDVARRSLRRNGAELELRPRSFDVLAYLAGAAGRPVGKGELLQAVWPSVVVTEESLTRCISDIRQALGDEGQRVIRTLPRRGYVFVSPLMDEPETTQIDGAPVAAASAPARPRRALQFAALAVLMAGVLAGIAAWRWQAAAGAADPPRLSIVVLPLEASRAGESQAWLADAMTDEITVDLSRIPDAFVIARSSAESYRGKGVDVRQVGRELGVSYVLQGQLDPADDALRLLLQLVDTRNAKVLWSERIEGGRHDLDGLRRRVTGAVANSLQVRLAEVESSRVRQLSPSAVGAQDLALQAWVLWRRDKSPEAVARQRELAQRAIALDAQSALAWATLAWSYTRDVSSRYTHLRGATREQWVQRAVDAADRAYGLDANDLRVIGARAFALGLQGRAQEALVLYERAIALNRNDAYAWFGISYANATLGRNRESIRAGHEAIRLSPRDVNLFGFYGVIAAAHLYEGEDAEALEWARRSALEKPDHGVAHSWVASAAALMGDMATAHSAPAGFRRLLPQYTVGSFRAEKLCANALCEAQRERYYEGLRKAGLPE
jgi:TolB-like protein/DNA-binding winged helix-turn-helix (wHTH) protein